MSEKSVNSLQAEIDHCAESIERQLKLLESMDTQIHQGGHDLLPHERAAIDAEKRKFDSLFFEMRYLRAELKKLMENV